MLSPAGSIAVGKGVVLDAARAERVTQAPCGFANPKLGVEVTDQIDPSFVPAGECRLNRGGVTGQRRDQCVRRALFKPAIFAKPGGELPRIFTQRVGIFGTN